MYWECRNVFKMKKKININRPEITSEEITKGKNFDSILKQHTILSKPLYKKPWFLSSVIVATVAVIATVVLLNNESKNIKQESLQQQSILNSDSTTLAEFYKKEEAKPCINPPLQGINIPYTTYKVIAEQGATLDFKTGSKIIIPKNAFVDENGKPLKGEVELRYREFHDAADFFVSGIPMTYDSAGVHYQFESAGMMEMLAYQNGKQVSMTPGKSVNVELASSYKGTDYNLYKLDTVKNNWSCLGKDKIEIKSNKISPKADTFKIARLELTPEYKTIETKKVEVQQEKETKIAALPKPLPEPKKPELAKKDNYTFDLDVNVKDFPELALYKGVLFEVGAENKNFNRSVYDIIWDEATIKEGTKKGENYLLALRKAQKKYELIVYPVFEGKNYETATKDFQDKFSKYNVILEKRKTEEKHIENEYQAKILALKKQQEELERSWKQAQDNQFNRMDVDEKVKRMFAVSSFGVFNSDKPSAYPTGISCSANLTDEKGTKLMCYDVFLVDRSKNGLFSYTRNPITKFSFNPQATNILWTVDNGILYWLKPEQFKDIKSSAEINNLKMNRVDQKFKNVEEVKAFFNI